MLLKVQLPTALKVIIVHKTLKRRQNALKAHLTTKKTELQSQTVSPANLEDIVQPQLSQPLPVIVILVISVLLAHFLKPQVSPLLQMALAQPATTAPKAQSTLFLVPPATIPLQQKQAQLQLA